MLPPDLPSREQFLAAGTEPDTCNICFEPFNCGHHPVRFTGSDNCGHVFGATCMQKWAESQNDNANKCPTCRRELFHAENANDNFSAHSSEPEEDIDDYDEEEEEGGDENALAIDENPFPRDLEAITTQQHARTFVKLLILSTRGYWTGQEYYSYDHFRRVCEGHGIFYFPTRQTWDWRRIRDMMKELWIETGLGTWDDDQIRVTVPRLAGILGWRLEDED